MESSLLVLNFTSHSFTALTSTSISTHSHVLFSIYIYYVIRDQFQLCICIQIQPKAILQTSGQDVDIGLTQEITEYHGRREMGKFRLSAFTTGT